MTQARARSGGTPHRLDAFTRAYEEGRFTDALAVFGALQHPSVEAAFLAARSYLVLAKPSPAINVLLGVNGNKRIACERDLLLGEAFGRTDDLRSADERLAAARDAAEELADVELSAEVGYRYVRRYLFEDEPSLARRYLPLAQSGRSDVARLNAIAAETLILSWEERFKEQAYRLTELLRSVDSQSPRFLDHRAAATQTLAVLVRELWLPDCASEIDRQLTGYWTADFRAHKFQSTKALAWSRALQGDYFNAFRHLRFATELAPTRTWEVVAACDRSYLARCIGESRWSRQELDIAESLSEGLDWHATLGEERIGLLLLAELFAPIDSAKAAMYLARHRELGVLKSPLHRKHDPRLKAFFDYSTAVTEIALNNKKRGLTDLRDARHVFERSGYDWRTARCLMAEHRITGDETLLDAASERLRDYGNSWLASELRSARQPSKQVSLPPMRRRVFEEACQGKSIPEIARTLGKSEFTISNHMKEIYKAFGVSSRSQLMADAARKGLIAPE